MRSVHKLLVSKQYKYNKYFQRPKINKINQFKFIIKRSGKVPLNIIHTIAKVLGLNLSNQTNLKLHFELEFFT